MNTNLHNGRAQRYSSHLLYVHYCLFSDNTDLCSLVSFHRKNVYNVDSAYKCSDIFAKSQYYGLLLLDHYRSNPHYFLHNLQTKCGNLKFPAVIAWAVQAL